MRCAEVQAFGACQPAGQGRCTRVCAAQRTAAAALRQQQRRQQRAPASQQQQQPGREAAALSRRAVLALPAGVGLLAAAARPAQALIIPPPGYRYHQDKLDGYSFFYPEDWSPVTTSGNDVFYRNPLSVEDTLFVDISSPSSSKYESVEDLGTPQEAAQRTVDQYLNEFLSTRLGVRRTTEILSASRRTGQDGRLYYDIQVRVASYASRNQLAVSQAEIDAGMEREWDRRYVAVLGVANKRLYEMRLQTSSVTFERDPERLATVVKSFQCREVVA